MQRTCALVLCLAAACVDAPDGDRITSDDTARAALLGHSAGRDHIVDDIYHHRFEIPVGPGPGARLVIHRVVRERAPWLPRPTTDGMLFAHGDFATFASNFAPVLVDPAGSPGLAVWLARRGIDVWGYDRRWTQTPAAATDFADHEDMGIDQQLGDIRATLSYARVIRLITGGNLDRMVLSGFSRGGQLAYFYAADEASRPPPHRHIKGLVPIDIYASLSPADEDLRLLNCETAAAGYAALAAGELAFSNEFFSDAGRRVLDAPDDPSPWFPGRTNRGGLYLFVGRTWRFLALTPLYHLAAPVLDGITVNALRFSPEAEVARWFAAAPPWQSWVESADTDALTCGDPPLPADLPLSRITVPLFYLGAAGGFGDHGLYSTTQVSSADVQTLVVRQLAPADEQEDFGHGDLLYAPAAAALAWQPLLSWLQQH